MGTRNITAIIKDGELKLSQYGQWDGYFSYTGTLFIDWVKENLTDKKSKRRSQYLKDVFKEKVDLLKPVTKEYKEKLFEVVEPFSNYSKEENLEYVIPFDICLPQFHRNTGVKILDIINNLKSYDFKSNTGFPVEIETDYGWVEYIYVIDLDKDAVFCLTCHDFKGMDFVLPSYIKELFPDMECFYYEGIDHLPSTKKIAKYVEEIGL